MFGTLLVATWLAMLIYFLKELKNAPLILEEDDEDLWY